MEIFIFYNYDLENVPTALHLHKKKLADGDETFQRSGHLNLPGSGPGHVLRRIDHNLHEE